MVDPGESRLWQMAGQTAEISTYLGVVEKKSTCLQGGPLPVISGVISPINGLING